MNLLNRGFLTSPRRAMTYLPNQPNLRSKQESRKIISSRLAKHIYRTTSFWILLDLLKAGLADGLLLGRAVLLN